METGVQIIHKPGVRQAAFFDLEKTLTPHATEQECALIFAKRGALPWSSLARVLYIYVKYDLGLISNFDEMKRFGAKIFIGRKHENDRQLMKTLFAERLHRFIYPQAHELMRRFKELGFEVYIVSSTYRFMVEPYAEALGVKRVYGVDLELKDGVCTGNITGTIYHQQFKAQVLHEAAAEGISLADSYAFGDSLNDLPMLEAVGHPVPVNPGSKLLAAAAKRGWEPIRWRMSAAD
jgi:HAD superfamily hydrolase (TIGR01490 family)